MGAIKVVSSKRGGPLIQLNLHSTTIEKDPLYCNRSCWQRKQRNKVLKLYSQDDDDAGVVTSTTRR